MFLVNLFIMKIKKIWNIVTLLSVILTRATWLSLMTSPLSIICNLYGSYYIAITISTCPNIKPCINRIIIATSIKPILINTSIVLSGLVISLHLSITNFIINRSLHLSLCSTSIEITRWVSCALNSTNKWTSSWCHLGHWSKLDLNPN